MYTDMEQRARELGEWIVENRATVRAAAARFGVSKSTVHKDMTERLRRIDRLLYEKVRLVLEQNKAERHIRGGDATRQKYRARAAGTRGEP
ncbi:MAG: sporulation transcriptional regulator SpoIIID [Oscillospiraceae bacterium]|nr:sporulation transcriptional regulator SpoIIID [Oscillospiraceae bacterium]